LRKRIGVVTAERNIAHERASDRNPISIYRPATVPPQDPVVEPATARPDPTTKAGTASSIGSGMSIVGNIECNGPAQVSIPKIPAGIRAVTQNQRIIRCDVCDHPPACNLHGRSVQVTTPA
jgi:hypothetical protein